MTSSHTAESYTFTDKMAAIAAQMGIPDTQSADSSRNGKSVLVVGANRGIGLQLVKTFQDRGWNAYGSVRPSSRNDPSVQDLRDTGATILYIDYTDEDSIIAAAKEYGDRALDCLVNCAGYGVKPDDSWSYTSDMILERFNVMALGPFLATKHFKPALEKSDDGKVVNISSSMASITNNNDEGENIGYRMAKAALNQQTKTLAQELGRAGSKICLLAIHPGAVPTKMSEGRGKLDVVESCNGMISIILKLNSKESGTFRDWKGAYLPW